MAVVESTISDIKQELTQQNVEIKILDILHDAYPYLDCGPGTPVYEMVVRPTAMLWQRQTEGVTGLIEAVDTDNYLSMPEVDLDNLLGRYFIKRRVGKYVTGVIRIFFSEPVTISISAGDIVTAGVGQVYEVISDHFATAEELSIDADGNPYRDVAVKSVGTGSTYNASAGTAVTVACSVSSYILKAIFILNTTDGGQREDNYAFFNRAKEELAAKNAFAYKSLRSLIYDNFEYVKEVIPIGIRDDEMIRDVCAVDGSTPIHLGGKCDIYIRPFTFETANKYRAPIGFPLTYKGKSLAEDPGSLMTLWNSAGYTVTNQNRSLRGSTKEVITGLETGINDGLTELTYDLTALDSFVESNDYCSLHTDNLVKLVFPLVVRVKLAIDSTSATNIAAVKAVVTRYINSLTSTEYPKVSDIIHLIKAATGLTVRMKDVENPMYMTAYYLNEYAEIEYIKIGKDQRSSARTLLIPQEPDSLKFIIDDLSQISLKTCCWYTNEDLVTVEGVM